jgi:hypothetical protein
VTGKAAKSHFLVRRGLSASMRQARHPGSVQAKPYRLGCAA